MITKAGHGLVAGLIVAALSVLIVGHQPSQMSVDALNRNDCTVLVWDELAANESDAQHVWDSHLSAGWHGDSRDHMEALWSPSCTDAYVGNLITEYDL